MYDILKQFNFKPPNIVAGEFGRVTVEEKNNRFFLKVDGQQWMMYDGNTYAEAYDFFSHYYFAEGHVTCTGMGFGIRENWLLTKPEVTRLTIVEKNQEVYDYHQQINSPFLSDPRVDVVIEDASNYKGSCDVLLLDHYEFPNHSLVLKDVYQIQNNINPKVMWFWPLEDIVMKFKNMYMLMHDPKYKKSLPLLMHTCGWYNYNDSPYEKNPINNFEAYQLLKNCYSLNALPKLTKSQFDMFCMMYESRSFK